jgi:hypothetical protein
MTPSRRQRKKYEERLQALRRSASKDKAKTQEGREPIGRRENRL